MEIYRGKAYISGKPVTGELITKGFDFWIKSQTSSGITETKIDPDSLELVVRKNAID